MKGFHPNQASKEVEDGVRMSMNAKMSCTIVPILLFVKILLDPMNVNVRKDSQKLMKNVFLLMDANQIAIVIRSFGENKIDFK